MHKVILLGGEHDLAKFNIEFPLEAVHMLTKSSAGVVAASSDVVACAEEKSLIYLFCGETPSRLRVYELEGV